MENFPTRLALLMELSLCVPPNSKHLAATIADDIEREVKLSADKLRKQFHKDHHAFHHPEEYN